MNSLNYHCNFNCATFFKTENIEKAYGLHRIVEGHAEDSYLRLDEEEDNVVVVLPPNRSKQKQAKQAGLVLF